MEAKNRPKIGQKSVSSIIQLKTISLFSGSSWSSSFRCPCCSTFWTFCVWGSTSWSHHLAQALGVTKSEYVNSSSSLARFYVVQKCFILIKATYPNQIIIVSGCQSSGSSPQMERTQSQHPDVHGQVSWIFWLSLFKTQFCLITIS